MGRQFRGVLNNLKYLATPLVVVLGSGTGEEAVVWQDSTQSYRLQLNPKIMLIESKYISLLHFSSTIVRDFLFSR